MRTGYVSLSKLPRTKFNCIHLNFYSLQKNTKFVDRVEQKVTTNPKLDQDRKSRSIERGEKGDLQLSFDCVHCNITFFTKKHMVCRSCGTKGHNKSETRSKSQT